MANPIGWCDRTWNPFSGCLPDFPCWDRCWARRMALRLRGRFGYDQNDPFQPTFHGGLKDPQHWRKPQRVFTCGMGDVALAGKGLREIFLAIAHAPQHEFVILTKRLRMIADRVHREGGFYPKNLTLGVSVWDQPSADALIPELLRIPAATRIVCAEPLLSSLDLTYWLGLAKVGPYDGKSWNEIPIEEAFPVATSLLQGIICGAETGPGARPCHPDWVRSLRDQCQAAGVPFWLKSLGEWMHESQLGSDDPAPASMMSAGFSSQRIHAWPDYTPSYRVGKRFVGDVLDGKQWKEWYS